MRARSLVLACATLLGASALLASCGREPPPSAEGIGAPAPPPPPRERARGDTFLDDDGVPLESEERVAGLVLPLGLELIIEEERRRVYASRLPRDPLLRYFGPRLVTLDVRESGENVTYREAVPRGVRGGRVILDVTIRPSSAGGSRVEIVERPPLPPEGTVITPDEIRQHFEERTKRRE